LALVSIHTPPSAAEAEILAMGAVLEWAVSVLPAACCLLLPAACCLLLTAAISWTHATRAGNIDH
jgi:hypothetical protein